MQSAPIPQNEQQRLSALFDYNILDTLPEKEFDDITRLASAICGTPISLVSIVDEGRQWFKSKQGLAAQETPRDVAFCAHAILQPEEIFVVPDASKDERFHDNPLHTGAPHVTFYAGVPLVTEDGYALGTLCVIDNKPRELNDTQRQTLRSLANQVAALLELRHKSQLLQKREEDLQHINQSLERFAHVAAHDLKSPINQVSALANLLQMEEGLTEEARELVSHIDYASHAMRQLIEGILRHSRIAHSLHSEKENFLFADLMQEVKALIPIPPHFGLYVEAESDDRIWSVKPAWLQLLINLVSNAVRYNDKEDGWVRISYAVDGHYYSLTVADNGIGIPADIQHQVFDLFQTVHDTELHQQPQKDSTGIGLHTVKTLVEKLDGKIRMMSEVGVGTTFIISIRK